MTGRGSKDEGAVLLTTLLVMSLMATLAVSIMEDVSYAVRRATVLDDAAQADAYLDGAEGFVTAQMRELTTTLEPEELNRLLAEPQVYQLPIEDGLMSLTVRDGTHCVSPADVLDAGGQRRFTRTLVELGVPRNEASSMTAALIDWQDADDQQTALGAEDGAYLLLPVPYRTAGSPITSVSEMRAVRGVTHEIWEALAPWMCVDQVPGRGVGRINVNTLPVREAALLAANLGKDEAFAKGLLTSRPAGGWTPEAFNLLDGIADDGDPDTIGVENPDLLTFSPDRVRVDIRVQYRDTVRRGALRLDIQGAEPEVLTRLRGEAALPRAKFAPEEDDQTNG